MILAGVLMLGGAAGARASSDDVGQGTFGVGVNYPGLGVKYFLSDNYSVEAKGQAENSVTLGGLRAYRYFRIASPSFLLYGGAEADYLHFKGDFTQGSGEAGGVFAGCEYFLASRLAVQVDFGPMYIGLKDKNYGGSTSGLEYVMNFGVNYYFGNGRGK